MAGPPQPPVSNEPPAQWTPPPPPAPGAPPPGQYPPQAPWTPMAQQPPPRRGLSRFIPLIVLVAIVAAVAGGYWLFRDRLSGEVGGLQVGDCIDLPAEDESITDVQHQPCNEAHDAEVFLLVTDPSARDAAYPIPARSHFLEIALAQCLPAATNYVGTDINERPDLDVGYFYPTSSSWANGDRGMTCYLYRTDEAKLTSSLRNSGGSSP